MEKPVFPGVRHFRDGQPKAAYFSKNPPPRPSLYYLTHFKPISQRRKFDLGHLRHFLRAKIQYRGTKWGHGCLKFHFLTALAWGKASKQSLSLWILEFWPLFCWVSPFLRLWILPEPFPWPCILKVIGNCVMDCHWHPSGPGFRGPAALWDSNKSIPWPWTKTLAHNSLWKWA